jgi:hypothetical protein
MAYCRVRRRKGTGDVGGAVADLQHQELVYNVSLGLHTYLIGTFHSFKFMYNAVGADPLRSHAVRRVIT